jgi:hypothetical protein
MLTLRANGDYVSRPDFISTKKRQSLMEIRPLAYNKQYYFLEFVCDSVKELVSSPQPKSFDESKVHQCVLFDVEYFLFFENGTLV